MAVHLAYPLEGLGVVVAVSGVHSVQPRSDVRILDCDDQMLEVLKLP